MSYSQLIQHLERSLFISEKFLDLLFHDSPTEDKQLKNLISATIGIQETGKESMSLLQETDSQLENFEVDSEKQIPIRGTINQFIWECVVRKKEVQSNFLNIFCLTYHGYMTTLQVFNKIKECYQRLVNEKRLSEPVIEIQFVSFIEQWIENSFFDFDAALIDAFTEWIKDTNLRENLKKRLENSLCAASQKNDSEVVFTFTEPLNLPETLFYQDFELFSLDVEEVAKQLTFYAGKYYYAISPKELLDCAWMKPQLQHRAPNIIQLTNHFNQLSFYVQHSILLGNTLQDRCDRWKYFVKLADTLWKMKNFSDGLAIAYSFTTNCIFRLNAHLEIIGKDVMAPINDILSEASLENNYKKLIALYESCEKEGIAIPFIGFRLQHLVFFYDGNQDYVDGLVNFVKCEGIYNLIMKILVFQKKKFSLGSITQIQDKIANITIKDDDYLMNLSLNIEPLQTTPKQLKRVGK